MATITISQTMSETNYDQWGNTSKITSDGRYAIREIHVTDYNY